MIRDYCRYSSTGRFDSFIRMTNDQLGSRILARADGADRPAERMGT